jgi:beta-phosphoglucomutase-like phosphatase (HAD superfamily)
MIQAMTFDLDGTLVQTEKLIAFLCWAIIELCAHEVSEDEVMEAFKQVVSRSRHELPILARLNLSGGLNRSIRR